MDELLESKTLLEPLHVSKWLKVPFLIDEAEMQNLLKKLEATLGPIWFYPIQGPVAKEQSFFSADSFLQEYRRYISFLKKGALPPLKEFQRIFACALSLSHEDVYALAVDEKRYLIKPRKPVLIMQENRIRYSKEDQAFRTQVYGKDCFTWGVQLSYPQIFQDSKTFEIGSVQGFGNTKLFKEVQLWLRRESRATPFLVSGKKQNEPIRLGKTCFQWISCHPQLKELNIAVDGAD